MPTQRHHFVFMDKAVASSKSLHPPEFIGHWMYISLDLSKILICLVLPLLPVFLRGDISCFSFWPKFSPCKF